MDTHMQFFLTHCQQYKEELWSTRRLGLRLSGHFTTHLNLKNLTPTYLISTPKRVQFPQDQDCVERVAGLWQFAVRNAIADSGSTWISDSPLRQSELAHQRVVQWTEEEEEPLMHLKKDYNLTEGLPYECPFVTIRLWTRTSRISILYL